MSSGVVQLIAIGAQDEHIMGSPEISFFTSTFKRHSNFSQSVEKQMMQGHVKNNAMTSIKFEKTGDMLGHVYIVMDDNSEALDSPDWTSIIDKVELYIGGHLIDSQESIFTEKNRHRYVRTKCIKEFKRSTPRSEFQVVFLPTSLLSL